MTHQESSDQKRQTAIIARTAAGEQGAGQDHAAVDCWRDGRPRSLHRTDASQEALKCRDLPLWGYFHLGPSLDLLRQALEAALAIRDEQTCVSVLSALAPLFPPQFDTSRDRLDPHDEALAEYVALLERFVDAL